MMTYTTKDLCRFFQTTSRTIRRWRRAGHLPPPIVPGRWRATDIEKILADKSGHLEDSEQKTISESQVL